MISEIQNPFEPPASSGLTFDGPKRGCINAGYIPHNQLPTPEHCIELLSWLPTRPSYYTWLRVVSAIGNTFDEETALKLLSSRFTDEKPAETTKKLKARLKNVGYGSLVHFAKQNGYIGKKSASYNVSINSSLPQANVTKERITFYDTDPNLLYIYIFDDESLEERAGIIQHDCNVNRINADKKVVQQYPTSKFTKERVFRLSVNRKVVNKTTDYYTLTFGYRNELLTLDQIANVVLRGYAICPAVLKETKDGSTHRKNENFKGSELIILDMDFASKVNGEKVKDNKNYISIEQFLKSELAQNVALIYTSCSHSAFWHRYRLIIPLPFFEINQERYAFLLKAFVGKYKSDTSRSDLCAAFYGNTNAQIFNLTTGEISNETHSDND